MAKSVSVYMEDQELAMLDRLAEEENRSRSAMLGEILRRYASIAESQHLREHPLFRKLSPQRLAAFLEEDRKTSADEVATYRRLLELT